MQSPPTFRWALMRGRLLGRGGRHRIPLNYCPCCRLLIWYLLQSLFARLARFVQGNASRCCLTQISIYNYTLPENISEVDDKASFIPLNSSRKLTIRFITKSLDRIRLTETTDDVVTHDHGWWYLPPCTNLMICVHIFYCIRNLYSLSWFEHVVRVSSYYTIFSTHAKFLM